MRDVDKRRRRDGSAGVVTAPFVVEIVVFLCGAVVMVLELVGSRLLAPYFGNSIFVWASLIGVMLGFMALGNFLGGRLGDRYDSTAMLFWILVGASASISAVAFVDQFIVPRLGRGSALQLGAALAAVVLFALPSTALGMVSPYCIRLRMHAVSDSGSTVGSLYALSTVGSIVGTFVAGFWLIAAIGSHNIIAWMAGIPLLLSGFFITPLIAKRVVAASAAVALLALAALFSRPSIDSFDTQYERYFIRRGTDERSGRPVLGLSRNFNSVESLIYADTGESVATPLYSLYDLALKTVPQVHDTLVVGGGAFAYPRQVLAEYPNSKVDAIEIDPKLVDVSRTTFLLRDDPRMRIFAEDGRTFLNSAKGQYDAVFMDAFKSAASVPYQLTTYESMKRVRDTLRPHGIAVVNIIGSVSGPGKRFFWAEYATLKTLFPHVEVFGVGSSDPATVQNVAIVAFKDPSLDPETLLKDNPELATHRMSLPKTPSGTRILTDDHAPVDQYVADLIGH